MKGAGGKPRLSSRVLQAAILQVFTEQRLFPQGVYAEIPSVQEWAMRHAKALKRLVSRFHADFLLYLWLFVWRAVVPNSVFVEQIHGLYIVTIEGCIAAPPSRHEASRLKRLVRRSKTAKIKDMTAVKALCRDCGWLFKPSKVKSKQKRKQAEEPKDLEEPMGPEPAEDPEEGESETWCLCFSKAFRFKTIPTLGPHTGFVLLEATLEWYFL